MEVDKRPLLGYFSNDTGAFSTVFFDNTHFNIRYRVFKMTEQLRSSGGLFILENFLGASEYNVWEYQIDISGLMQVRQALESYHNFSSSDVDAIVRFCNVLVMSIDSSVDLVIPYELCSNIERYYTGRSMSKFISSLDYVSSELGIPCLVLYTED